MLELLGEEDEMDICVPVPENPPCRCHLYASPGVLASSPAIGELLAECARLAGEAGARELDFPCPCDLELNPERVQVLAREFAFAWFRKSLAPG